MLLLILDVASPASGNKPLPEHLFHFSKEELAWSPGDGITQKHCETIQLAQNLKSPFRPSNFLGFGSFSGLILLLFQPTTSIYIQLIHPPYFNHFQSSLIFLPGLDGRGTAT